MEISIVFIGRAEPLAELYEGVVATSFVVTDLRQRDAQALVLPGIGDHVSLRMTPGPDTRKFRCTARHFDFSEAGQPTLTIELDMP